MRPLRDASIVVIGSFNPAILQPEWFRRHDILPEYEVENVYTTPNGLVVHNEVTVLTFKSLRLEVQRERLTLATERQDWIKDLGGVAGSIFDRLKETPVSMVGLNFQIHSPIEGGNALSLAKRWGKLDALGSLVGENPRPTPVVRADWETFVVTVAAEVSVRMAGALYVSQNYEKKVASVEPDLLRILAAEWTRVAERATNVFEAILAGPAE